MKNAGAWAGALLLLLVGADPEAYAAGFSITEQSARALGTSYAGEAAVAQDASTVFFNPAGMTRLSGTWLTLSGSLIQYDGDFENDGSFVNPAVGGGPLRGDPTQNAGGVGLVPAGYVTQEVGERWVVGFGMTSPFGLRTEYARDWVGRYSALLSDLKTFDFSPVVAVRLGRGVSLGGGLDLQYVHAQLTSMLDLGTLCMLNAPKLGQSPSVCPAIGLAPQSVDGFIRIKGDSVALGGNVGVMWEIDSNTRLGVSWRSRIDHTLESTAQFSIPQSAAILRQQSGALKNTGGRADLNLPDIVRVGFFHRFDDRWAVMGGVDWTHWARFQELVFEFDNPAQPDAVEPENWKDVWRGGLAVAFSPTSRWTFRLGSAYDQTPVPNARFRTPRIPDGDRVWLSSGLAFQATDRLRIDLGYAHLFSTGSIPIRNPDPLSGNVVRGSYAGRGNLFGAQVSLQLD